jgi:O-antigen/teichoic acid export membrane protein
VGALDRMAAATGQMAAYTAVAAAAGFVIEFLLARRLGVRAYGNMGALLALAAQLSVGQTTLQLAVARQVARTGTLCVAWWRLAHGAGAALAALGVSGGWLLDRLWHLPAGSLPFIFLVATAWFHLGVLRGVAQGLENYRLYGTSLMVENLVRLAATALLVGPLGVWGGLAAIGAGAVSAALWAQAAIARPPADAAPLPWRALAWTLLGVGMTALTPRLDLLVVKRDWDAVAAGVWAALSLFGQGFNQLPWLAATVMFPRVVRDRVRRRAYFGFGAALSLAVLLAAAGLGWFAIPRFAAFFFAGRYDPWLGWFGPYLFAVIPVALYGLWISYAVADDRRDLLLFLAAGIGAYALALLVHHRTMPDILVDYLVLAVVEAAVLVRAARPESPAVSAGEHATRPPSPERARSHRRPSNRPPQ